MSHNRPPSGRGGGRGQSDDFPALGQQGRGGGGRGQQQQQQQGGRGAGQQQQQQGGRGAGQQQQQQYPPPPPLPQGGSAPTWGRGGGDGGGGAWGGGRGDGGRGRGEARDDSGRGQKRGASEEGGRGRGGYGTGSGSGGASGSGSRAYDSSSGRGGPSGSGSASGRFLDSSSGGGRPSNSSYGSGRPGSSSSGGRSFSAPARGRKAETVAVQDLKNVLRNVPPPKPSTTLPNGHVLRPNLGKVGYPTTVIANHFKVAKLEAGTTAWQYDIAIVKEPRPRREPEPGAAGASSSMSRMQLGGRQELPGPPPMPDKNRCHALLNKLALEKKWPRDMWAYDGQKIMFTAQEFLPPHETIYTVSLQDPNVKHLDASQQALAVSNYKISIKSTAILDISGDLEKFKSGELADFRREAMQVLDVALRQTATRDPNNRMMGRGVYTSEGKINIGLGTEAWHGYVQALNSVQSGLTVTIDKAVAAMHMMTKLTHWMMNVLGVRDEKSLGMRPLTNTQIDQLNDVIRRKGITVQVTHRLTGKSRHRLKGFTDKPANQMVFELKEGGKTNVAAYFEKTYKKLQYPSLPCVIAGSSKRPDWIPVECCVIVPETGRRALGPDETREILRIAAVEPSVRQRAVMDVLYKKSKLHMDPVAKAFGLKMEDQPQMMRVKARVLPSPRLEYGAGQHLDPGSKGDWNIQDTKLYRTVELKSFGVVSYVPERMLYDHAGRNLMQEFLHVLYDALTEKGLKCSWSPAVAMETVVYKTRDQSHRDALLTSLRGAQAKMGPPQIVFVLQEFENQVYNDIKLLCDCDLGIHSQCLVAPQMGMTPNSKPGAMGRKLAGVALKLNTKLGGDNWKVSSHPGIWVPTLSRAKDERSVPRVMLLGADVSHPTNLPETAGNSQNTDPNKPAPDMNSVAAVVGSINPHCTRYAARVFAQSPLQEYVDGMGGAVLDLLKVWAAKNGNALPEAIVMFRDGVSDGQFNAVMARELESIKWACTQFPQYKPRITFACVQKRHQTRLYASDDPSSGDFKGSGNVAPGLVVDTDICHPKEFDFYLNSHAGIQGTNKPAKYHVLYDDNGFNADSMQLFSYWLCHTFCRCTRTVSYCPPAYYAHHAAFRGRCWLRKEDIEGSVTSGTSASSAPYVWRFHPLHARMLNEMYFI